MPFIAKYYKGQTAGVIGLGKSGQAVAKLLLKNGFKVLGSDSRPAKELKSTLSKGFPRTFRWEGSGHSEKLLKCGFIVKSPGLPPHLPIFQKLREAHIPVYSELEIALAFSKCREIVAITGTNGKTTTTALTAEIFKGARRGKVYACGNIGLAISEVAPKARSKDTLVVEASSYQLEDSTSFRPQAAALLNITADHLDHHGSMDAYIEAKARVFNEQQDPEACVFNAADPLAFKLSRRARGKKLFFGPPEHGRTHAWVAGGKIKMQLPGQKKEVALVPPDLPGRHNLENAMAAALLAASRGIKPAQIQKAFKKFRGVEHRLEDIGAVRGIRCINDSKATNVDSTMVALEALASENAKPPRVLLILGGLHKGSPYTPLRGLIERCVKGILTIGSAARKVDEDLGGLVPILPCVNLETAVQTAFQIGDKGDLLLLSPACASFDQFKNFEERGRRFKELVRAQK